ncbi:MAG: hypothetical protein ACR2KL_10830 [Nocardioidaceae bacterium]
MTDNTTEPVEDAGSQPPTAEEHAAVEAAMAQEAPAGESDEATGNREAAKYRVRLRESETALQASQDRLTAYQRAEVERLAGERLSVAADLFAVAGTSVVDFVDEESGMVDGNKVHQAVSELLDQRPGLRRPSDRFPDLGGGQRGSAPETAASWSEVLRGR